MKISWLVDKRVILIEVSHEFTMDDVIDLNQQVKTYLEEGDTNTHVIGIIQELTSYPNNLKKLIAQLDYPQHPNIGWNITVTQNRVIRYLGSLIYKVSGKSTLRFARTYTSAKAMLSELDPSLPELPELSR